MTFKSALFTGKFRVQEIPEFSAADIDWPKVSIIIPFSSTEYAPRLHYGLESIELQQHIPHNRIEIILLYLTTAQENMGKLDQLVQQHNTKLVSVQKGYSHFPLAFARNAGARNASGEMLCFVDADMILDPEAIARSARDPMAFSSIWALYLNQDYSSGKFKQKDPRQFRWFVRDAIRAGCRVSTTGYGGFLMVPRKLFEKVRGYDEEFDGGWGAEDNDMVDRLYRAGEEMGYRFNNVSSGEGVVCVHQWHHRPAHDRSEGTIQNRERYDTLTTNVRNDEGWGGAKDPTLRPMPSGKPKVLLVSDVRGWAFDQNMQDLEQHLSDRFDFEHGYVSEWRNGYPDFYKYDVVYVLYHGWGLDRVLPWDRTLGALRSRWIFSDKRRPPAMEEFTLVNRHVAYQIACRSAFLEFEKRCPGVRYLTNPVNMKRFPKPTEICGQVIASWNGNAKHVTVLGEYVKGFYDIVIPACKQTGVKLESAEYHTNRLQPSQMPAFYQRSNVALCASIYEAASNSTMEALASGLALITTDVGNHQEIRHSQLEQYGDTGIIIVDRNIESFVAAIKQLKADPARVRVMGELNRKEIERAWSWDVWADRYAEFLMIPFKGR